MTRALHSTVLALFAPGLLAGAAGFSAPDVTVGRNLQVSASVILPKPAAEGVQLTITAEDPTRVKFATSADHAGAASITVLLQPNAQVSPPFWIHGLGETGSVSYTIAGAGIGTAKGTVTL